jgi:hypothetical protein
MSRHFTTLAMLLLSFTITACATNTPPQNKTEKPSPQVEPLALLNATVIKFKIPMGTTAEFQMLNKSKQSHEWDYVTSIKFNDESCATGHQVSLVFKNNSGDHYLYYFDKEAPWKNINTLTLSWDSTKKHLIAVLNDESIEVKVDRLIRFLKVSSAPSKIDIISIEHPQE